MSLQDLRQSMPDYAKDIKINLGRVLDPETVSELTKTQIWGTALASAYATKDPCVISAIQAEAASILPESEMNGVKSAAAIMGMNNVYYRFLHLASDKELGRTPANLRMKAIADHGIDKLNFELYALAVSSINACGMCIDAHIKSLIDHGMSREAIVASLRISSTVHAAAQVMTMQRASSDESQSLQAAA